MWARGFTAPQPPTVDEVEEARANVVLDKVRATLKSGEYKRQDQLIERLLEEGFSSTDIASALLHHLQGGESTPAAKPAREEAVRPRYERPVHPARRERYGSREEPSRRRERPPEPQRHAIARPPAGTESAGTLAPSPQATAPIREEAPRHAKPGPVHPPHPPKTRHGAPEGQTCLHLNVGKEMGVSEGDVVGTILGETGLPRTVVGAVDVRERHLFVYVASEHANSILSKLNRTQIKGRKAKAKVA